MPQDQLQIDDDHIHLLRNSLILSISQYHPTSVPNAPVLWKKHPLRSKMLSVHTVLNLISNRKTYSLLFLIMQ